MGKIIRTKRDRRELQRRLFVAAVASFVAINVYILMRPTATASGVLEHLPTQAGEGAHRWVLFVGWQGQAARRCCCLHGNCFSAAEQVGWLLFCLQQAVQLPSPC